MLLGGIGTLSLVVEPAAWLLAGGSPTAFLAEADGSMLLITGLRVVHIAAVVRPLTRARTPRRLGAVVL